MTAPVLAAATNTPPVILVASIATNAPPTATNAPQAAIAPVWREFSAKCADGTAKRTDLIVFKRFVASSALDDAAKKVWTDKARKLYRQAYSFREYGIISTKE